MVAMPRISRSSLAHVRTILLGFHHIIALGSAEAGIASATLNMAHMLLDWKWGLPATNSGCFPMQMRYLVSAYLEACGMLTLIVHYYNYAHLRLIVVAEY